MYRCCMYYVWLCMRTIQVSVGKGHVRVFRLCCCSIYRQTGKTCLRALRKRVFNGVSRPQIQQLHPRLSQQQATYSRTPHIHVRTHHHSLLHQRRTHFVSGWFNTQVVNLQLEKNRLHAERTTPRFLTHSCETM